LLLGLLLGSMLQLIFPFLTQAIVDVGISNQNIGFIYLVLLAQMALFLSRTMGDFIRRWILLMLENCLTVQNYSAVFLTGNIWNYLLSKAKILSNHIRIRTNNKISI
jgi:ATP-binding cassette, subfamily B, bacterial